MYIIKTYTYGLGNFWPAAWVEIGVEFIPADKPVVLLTRQIKGFLVIGIPQFLQACYVLTVPALFGFS